MSVLHAAVLTTPMEGIRGELSQPRGFPCSLWKGRKSQNKSYTNKLTTAAFLLTEELLNELPLPPSLWVLRRTPAFKRVLFLPTLVFILIHFPCCEIPAKWRRVDETRPCLTTLLTELRRWSGNTPWPPGWSLSGNLYQTGERTSTS